ncbi:MAG: glycosyltransferase family 4 protein [Hyphomonadaceae bacterium]|nr:glycosyltransferase family 4 protein [Hyphomonadaceae bacterium]
MSAGPLSVIVAQIGARHYYAVPRILHARGALERFYTDFTLHGALGRLAGAAASCASPALGAKVRRRVVSGVPSERVYSAPMVNLRPSLRRGAQAEARYTLANELFGEQMIRWGIGEANVVYAMYNSGMPFWKHAKARGLKIAVDVFITPLYQQIVERELAMFPDWELASGETGADQSLVEQRMRETIEVADLLLCPAENVRGDLLAFAKQAGIASVPPAVIVPYGSSVSQGQASMPQPETGRVLYAGQAVLRKGIHYFAAAASMLSRGAGAKFDFRVAGHTNDRVRGHPDAGALNFLGLLSRDQMRAEYQRADVFVLPTLAEGSASVVHEALAAGLPVITTRSAGSVVTHGREGLIIPERESEALAAAIEKIVTDRPLRGAMARAALATAAQYGEGPWGDRLTSALAALIEPQLSRAASETV